MNFRRSGVDPLSRISSCRSSGTRVQNPHRSGGSGTFAGLAPVARLDADLEAAPRTLSEPQGASSGLRDIRRAQTLMEGMSRGRSGEVAQPRLTPRRTRRQSASSCQPPATDLTRPSPDKAPARRSGEVAAKPLSVLRLNQLHCILPSGISTWSMRTRSDTPPTSIHRPEGAGRSAVKGERFLPMPCGLEGHPVVENKLTPVCGKEDLSIGVLGVERPHQDDCRHEGHAPDHDEPAVALIRQ